MTTFMHPGNTDDENTLRAASDGDATRDRPPCPVAGTQAACGQSLAASSRRITPPAGTLLIPRGICRYLPERPE